MFCENVSSDLVAAFLYGASHAVEVAGDVGEVVVVLVEDVRL